MRSTLCRTAWTAWPAALLALATANAKEEAWRHDSASAFQAAESQHVVVSEAGNVRLAHAIERVGEIDAERVWALARAKDGGFYAATGDKGRVYHRMGDGPWKAALDAEDSQALSLAAMPDGRVFVGTGPSGQVIELTDPEHPASQPGPEVQYIWGLAAGSDGALYAATGPGGQLWKRPAGGDDWVIVFDSPQKHLLCIAVGEDGSIFAGSDGEGLIYRIGADGEASVLYDAPQDEIHTLLIGPDGILHAGTADGRERPASSSSRGKTTGDIENAPPRDPPFSAMGPIRRASRIVQDRPRPIDSSPSGTARPKASPSGENAVYRIEPEGAVREIFRERALIYALAWQGDRLLIGTGPEGGLYEVRGPGPESAEVARVDHGQVLALLAGPGGDVLLGVGDPGGILRLDVGHARSGTLTSEVLDAKLKSRFGTLSWQAEQPSGTSIAVRLRTGNVGKPDETWSDWSEPLSDPNASRPVVPPGRFAQYQITLATDDPDTSPALKAVTLYYRTQNLAPEIARIRVPDLTAADGAARRTKLDLKWDASDPNDDDLTYTLAIRKEGWPDWIALGGPMPLTESSFSWDTTAFPAGVYRLRVSASDRGSNPPREALTSSLSSVPFVVDHQAPGVALEVAEEGRSVRVELRDDLTRLVKAEYALDGGDWAAVFPDDGLFDANRETLAIALPALKAGTHVLMIRATDAAGNVGTGDVVLQRP